MCLMRIMNHDLEQQNFDDQIQIVARVLGLDDIPFADEFVQVLSAALRQKFVKTRIVPFNTDRWQNFHKVLQQTTLACAYIYV